MHRLSTPIIRDIVLLGGGHAHVAVLKRFGMHPLPDVRLTLISSRTDTPYSGMLPGLIAGHYTREQAHIDLHPLCRFAQAQFYPDTVVGLDLARKQVLCARRPPVAFDILSIDIGSTPKSHDVPGAAEHALPVKPIDRFLSALEELTEPPRHEPAPFRVAVVGGGAGGVELTLSLQYRLEHTSGLHHAPEFHLISASPVLLPTHNRRVQVKFMRLLQERNVELHLQHRVTKVDAGRLRCEQGTELPFETLIWVTDAAAPAWIRPSGLEVDAEGFIRVGPTLQSLSHPFVFAAGDVASMVAHPRPKSGVFAVRAGPPLARNLARVASGHAPKPFRPQRQFLSLISTGDHYAVASRGPLAWEGRWVWRWKDSIDRKWVRQYQQLPPIDHLPAPQAGRSSRAQAPPSTMRCGGCGAKVSGQILARVLARLDPGQREDVLIGMREADDAALALVPAGQAAVQTVDFFRAFINDPYRLGQIAANHALGDIYAMGALPQSALAVVTLPVAAPPQLEEQLFQLLSGGVDILRAHETLLAGGHTAEGAELAIGFAVHGLIDPRCVLRKSGLRSGDNLILTKSLGTGALFAADMRGQARGRWIESAVQGMLQSSRAASTCFLQSHATACTDVTGFGLLGHLVEMLRASRVAAHLTLTALPILEGAAECWEKGVFSSLHPENLRQAASIIRAEESTAHPLWPALFDPQTAGGLLAGVPAGESAACLEKLRHLGYRSARIIGTVVPATDGPQVLLV